MITLSDKDKALLQHYADGETIPEIAQALGRTNAGTKGAFRIIRRKLEANNTCHAVVIALRRGWID
jgi:DNA-binding NarL/FixJ family response regulator